MHIDKKMRKFDDMTMTMTMAMAMAMTMTVTMTNSLLGINIFFYVKILR